MKSVGPLPGLFLILVLLCGRSAGNCTASISFWASFADQAVVDLEINCPGGSGDHTGGTLTLASDLGPGYTFPLSPADYHSFNFTFLDGETLTASLVLQTPGGDLSYSENDFESGSTVQETLFHGPPNFDFVTLESVSTPGIVDLSSGSTVGDIAIAYSFDNMGWPPEFEILIFSLENLTTTLVAQFDNQSPASILTSNVVNEAGADSTGSATFSIDFALYEAGTYVVDVSFDGGTSAYYSESGSFSVVAAGEPGSSQGNPILPDFIDENGNFVFWNISGNTSYWMDPPLAFGYVYQTTNEALIASIDGLPTGIDPDGLFTIHTGNQIFENVSVTDTFDFSGETGGGIRWFAITDVGPVDAEDASAFPIQMTFTETADLCVTPLKIPEMTLTRLRVADSGDPRKPSGWFVDVNWTFQTEFSYLLEESTDLASWHTANTPSGNVWTKSAGNTAFATTDKAFYRVRTNFLGPNLKYTGGGGGGPVIVTPPPPIPYWPFGPTLPPLADFFEGFAIQFADVGDPGNDPDSGTGLGAVAYDFRMDWHEVSRGMIDAYNASADNNPPITMADMTGLGGNDPDQPATGISWNEAARFVNWMNTSTGHSPAYKFTTTGGSDSIALWSPGENGYDTSNPYRNSEAKYFLPSADEWYKSAYHVAGGSGYYDYPTGSNMGPTPVSEGTALDTAVWNNQSAPAPVYSSGGLSPHGTRGQGGNVLEWVEGAFDGTNDSISEDRITQGGAWSTSAGIHSGSWSPFGPDQEHEAVGFRVASKP